MVYYFPIRTRIVPKPAMTQRSKFVSKRAKRYLAWKEEFGFKVKERMTQRGWELLEGSVAIGCVIWRKGKRKADLKNLVASIEDALNGIVWLDDSQISEYLFMRVRHDAREDFLFLFVASVGERPSQPALF